VLKWEVILGATASAIAILGFMARAWANIRAGKRVRRLSQEISVRADAELERMRSESEAAEELAARRRTRDGQ
jgi:hypothetical protein